ncbi:DUF1178 family protein [Novosphingobium malaysiense]|uniref:Uncharacterized protein n=1 Tax=Novosphingobium malaysiense TaxID=1348853 RepID=A0A0B1ZQP5_9SPHN|nr:DUF1178 family protein [Novosphingobium malaysiense]KHK91568.1 hypothetical protein LK12_12225 [Novosphingobium malaysiense]
MIVYDLQCRGGSHRFEGWFKSSDDFASQRERGLVACPYCGSADVDKAMQAPRLSRKSNQLPEPSSAGRPAKPQRVEEPAEPAAPVANAPLPPKAVELMHKLAKMQEDALKDSRYVGQSFAEDARAIHYGERDAEAIHGETTLEEAQELLDEGISVMPLPFPVTPPDSTN